MTYVIGFNGPPHCGKDTVANRVAEIIGSQGIMEVHREALSLPMRLVGFALIGMPYTEKDYAEIKDVPDVLLDGETFRRFMIRFSEEFIKPSYGHDFWAKCLDARNEALYNRRQDAIIIVSDIGFEAEVQWFYKHTEFCLIHMARIDTDWSKDSRGYVGAPINTIKNNGTVEEAAEHVISTIRRMGWTA